MTVEAVRVGLVVDEVLAGRVRPDRSSVAGYVGALLDGCPQEERERITDAALERIGTPQQEVSMAVNTTPKVLGGKALTEAAAGVFKANPKMSARQVYRALIAEGHKISVSESSFVNGGASPARKLAGVPGAAPKRKAPAKKKPIQAKKAPASPPGPTPVATEPESAPGSIITASVALEFGSSILRATRDGAGRWTVTQFCGEVHEDDLERLVDLLWGASA